MLELLNQIQDESAKLVADMKRAGASDGILARFEKLDALGAALTTRIIAEIDLLTKKIDGAAPAPRAAFVDQHGKPL